MTVGLLVAVCVLAVMVVLIALRTVGMSHAIRESIIPLAQSVNELATIVNEVIRTAGLTCPHGLLLTIHCFRCEEEGNRADNERARAAEEDS